MYFNLWPSEVSELLDISRQEVLLRCSNGQIYAEAVTRNKCMEHMVPLESLARYLFVDLDARKKIIKEGGTTPMRRYLLKFLREMDSADQKCYSLQSAAFILDISVPTLVKQGLQGRFGKRCLFVKSVSLIEIMAYLHGEEGAFEKLKKRYELALPSKPGVDVLREVVIAYSYYKEYGYVF